MLFSFFSLFLLPCFALGADPKIDANIQKALQGIMKEFKLQLSKAADQSALQMYQSQRQHADKLVKRRHVSHESQWSYAQIHQNLEKQNNETLKQYYPKAFEIVYKGAYGLDKTYSNYGTIQKRAEGERARALKDVKLMKKKLTLAWEDMLMEKKIQKRAILSPAVVGAAAGRLGRASAPAAVNLGRASAPAAGRAAAAGERVVFGSAARAALRATSSAARQRHLNAVIMRGLVGVVFGGLLITSFLLMLFFTG